ncbi:MAG: PEP-CTERM sorting domain-containing protein [Phycisphaerales bacterium]|nr:PEP-CTERM sorting domain-containing protein [Phycisphaerales bacterium]
MRGNWQWAGVAALFLGTYAAVATAGPTVIFSNIQTSPTSDVPGLPGEKFRTGTGNMFERPYLSPDGSRWIFRARLEGAALTADEIIVVGGGTNGAGANVVLREGTATFFDGSINWNTIDSAMGINDSGSFAFTADTTAATTMDDVVVRWSGGGWELIAREGSPIPGHPDSLSWGSANDSIHILANGDVRFRSATLPGATTQQLLWNAVDLNNGTLIAQTDVTVPAGQLVPPPQTIDLLTANRFRSDATGANFIYHGDLNGPTTTDLFIIVNRDVVAQEGVPLPNSGFAENVSTFSADNGSQQISPYNGHYIFRGSNQGTNADWVYLDGQVVATKGAPIFPGATEVWDDARYAPGYFLNVVNSHGDFVIGGLTNSPDDTRDAVLVYNNEFVLVREGDPVDVSGNGLFDDDAYIRVFNNDDAVLTDDGWFYFTADLQNGAGQSIGQAYLVLLVPEPTAMMLLGFAGVLIRRR